MCVRTEHGMHIDNNFELQVALRMWSHNNPLRYAAAATGGAAAATAAVIDSASKMNGIHPFHADIAALPHV